MKTLIRGLAGAVKSAPVAVIIAALLLTLGFGAAFAIIAPPTVSGNEGFAPDNPEIRASERISELFGSDSQTSVVQVIVRDLGGNVITTRGLAAVDGITEAVMASGAAQSLMSTQPGQPPIVSYLGPVFQAMDSAGLTEDGLADDASVQKMYRDALSSPDFPAEQRGFVEALLSTDADTSAATAEAGLILIFLQPPKADTPDAAFDAQIKLESQVADAVRSVHVDGLEIRPFSFSILFENQDEFAGEVGVLFGAALAIIIVILLFLFLLAGRGPGWIRIAAAAGGVAASGGVLFGTKLEGAGGIANAVAAGVVIYVILRAVFGRLGRAPSITQGARRALADMAVTIITIVFAIGWMQGIGAILLKVGIIGSFNQITQIIPVLLIGLGVDYSIHLTARYREEIGAGQDVDGAIRTAIGTVGVALTLATVTTAIGFLTNIFSPIPALKDFGILAAVGIGSSFVLMLTFVPAIREILDRRAERKGVLPASDLDQSSESILSSVIERTSLLAERIPVLTVILALALGGLGVWGLSNLETRFSFTDFLPEDSPVVETLGILQAEFGGGFGESSQVLVEAPEGGTLGSAEAHNAMVDAAAALATTEFVVTFDTPGGPVAQASSPVGLLQRMFAPGPDGAPAAPPAVAEAAAQVDLGPDMRVPSGTDVTPLYRALAAAVPDQAAAILHFDGDRIDAALFDVGTQAGEERASQLQTNLNGAFAPMAALGVSATATSSQIISAAIVNALASSQTRSLLITLVIATLVLAISFWLENRRPFLGVLTMIPVALVVFWTYGLMYATGIPFGPVTATLAALAVGIGVPFTIHIARRFEEDRVRFDTLEEALRSTTRHTGGALAGSAFTTMAGFGILVTSTLKPFQQMGQVTVYAIGLSLLGAILVLPSLLALWEAWHQRRGDAVVERETQSVL